MLPCLATCGLSLLDENELVVILKEAPSTCNFMLNYSVIISIRLRNRHRLNKLVFHGDVCLFGRLATALASHQRREPKW